MATNENVTKVSMVDVNHRALDLAKRNAVKNKVDGKTKIFESNGFLSINEKFDTIITNPPIRAGKEALHQMYMDAKKHLNNRWMLILGD